MNTSRNHAQQTARATATAEPPHVAVNASNNIANGNLHHVASRRIKADNYRCVCVSGDSNIGSLPVISVIRALRQSAYSCGRLVFEGAARVKLPPRLNPV